LGEPEFGKLELELELELDELELGLELKLKLDELKFELDELKFELELDMGLEFELKTNVSEMESCEIVADDPETLLKSEPLLPPHPFVFVCAFSAV
jgi:hypothetical protein